MLIFEVHSSDVSHLFFTFNDVFMLIKLILYPIPGFYFEGTNHISLTIAAAAGFTPLSLSLLSSPLLSSPILSLPSLSLYLSLPTVIHRGWCRCLVQPRAAVWKDEPPAQWRESQIWTELRKSKNIFFFFEASFFFVFFVFFFTGDRVKGGRLSSRIAFPVCASVWVCVSQSARLGPPTQWCETRRWILACGGAGKR